MAALSIVAKKEQIISTPINAKKVDRWVLMGGTLLKTVKKMFDTSSASGSSGSAGFYWK